jgi:hypothetical protein
LQAGLLTRLGRRLLVLDAAPARIKLIRMDVPLVLRAIQRTGAARAASTLTQVSGRT